MSTCIYRLSCTCDLRVPCHFGFRSGLVPVSTEGVVQRHFFSRNMILAIFIYKGSYFSRAGSLISENRPLVADLSLPPGERRWVVTRFFFPVVFLSCGYDAVSCSTLPFK